MDGWPRFGARPVSDRPRFGPAPFRTGKTIWSDTFPANRATYYASPLIANGILYARREDGVVFVASLADDKLKLLAENNLEEPVIGSPVPASNRLFIRGEKHLFFLTTSP